MAISLLFAYKSIISSLFSILIFEITLETKSYVVIKSSSTVDSIYWSFNLKDTKPATEKEATIVIKKPKINFE